MTGAKAVHPRYLNPLTSRSAGGRCNTADAAADSPGGHALHESQSSACRNDVAGALHFRHPGRGTAVRRDAHTAQRGGPAGTPTPHTTHAGGSKRSMMLAMEAERCLKSLCWYFSQPLRTGRYASLAWGPSTQTTAGSRRHLDEAALPDHRSNQSPGRLLP